MREQLFELEVLDVFDGERFSISLLWIVSHPEKGPMQKVDVV